MTKQEFLNQLEELLEIPTNSLIGSEELSSLAQWDSLAFVSFLAMADSKYGAKVAPSALRQCKTVSDLMGLVEKK